MIQKVKKLNLISHTINYKKYFLSLFLLILLLINLNKIIILNINICE